MRPLLVIILVIATGGLAFSGYLSYRELVASPAGECGAIGDPGTILGAPPCVYGLFMYLAIVVLAALAVIRRTTAR